MIRIRGKDLQNLSTDYIKKMCIYTMENCSKRNPVICNSLDEPGGYWLKWNKLGTENQLPYDLTNMWNLKKLNSLESWLPEIWRWWAWGDVDQRIQNFHQTGRISSRYLLYNIVTIATNSIYQTEMMCEIMYMLNSLI